MNNLSISLVQADLIWESREANFRKLDGLLNGASSLGDLILLPEMFSTGFSMKPTELWDEPQGENLAWMSSQAAKRQAAICGSAIVKDQGSFYNRLYFVYPSGEYHTYDKKHLFTLAGEEKVYSPGSEHLTLDFKGWKIMPLICYDLRFPAWCRNTNEADLLLFVANWPERRSEPWKALLKARAIENMIYVAGVNRVGVDGNGVTHSGDSGAYDELGALLKAAEPHMEEIVTLELDKEKMMASRERFRFLADRDNFYFLD